MDMHKKELKREISGCIVTVSFAEEEDHKTEEFVMQNLLCLFENRIKASNSEELTK